MTHVSNREIASMSAEALKDRLKELQEELLQLRAEQALGGTPSNMGAFQSMPPLNCKNQDQNGIRVNIKSSIFRR